MHLAHINYLCEATVCQRACVCEYAFVCAALIPLHATIWPSSEALRYHNQVSGRPDAQERGCRAKTFARLDLRRQTLLLKQYFTLIARVYAHLDVMTK